MSLWSRLVAGIMLRPAGRHEYKALERASENPAATSAHTLRAILEYARGSAFGKEHDFSSILEAKSDEELFSRYAAAVKPCDYEDMRPYVERQKKGERDVLFPGSPVLYAKTSGTTAEPKWIPVSERYLNSVYNRMTRLWLYNFVKLRPGFADGKVLGIVDKAVEGFAPDGTPVGSVSGFTRSSCPYLFEKGFLSNPSCVYAIKNYTARYYVLMRLAVAQNISAIFTANPSTILGLCNNAALYYDEYVRDIEKGTLSEKFDINAEIRADICATLRPDPERAAFLRSLKEKHGTVLPKHYWPEIQVLCTWKCGNTKIFADKFRGFFPDTMLHQELGYFSSECRFGLVLDESLNTVLFPQFHYYEFVPEEQLDSENPVFLRIEQLEEGKRYCPYVTTCAGLYRYNMNDLLEAGPKFMGTPTVHMVQKINGIISITGEKLHESQFIAAVHETEAVTGMQTDFFIGFADLDSLSYSFFYEFREKDISDDDVREFTDALDAVLKCKNIEYKAKRDSLRLGAPRGHALVSGAFCEYRAACMENGSRDGQFKLELLQQNEQRHDAFRKLVRRK